MSFDPMDRDDAKKKITSAADSLRELAMQKDRASRLNPGRDASAENVAKARAENWNGTSWNGWALEKPSE
jgi:hypothetical protein